MQHGGAANAGWLLTLLSESIGALINVPAVLKLAVMPQRLSRGHVSQVNLTAAGNLTGCSGSFIKANVTVQREVLCAC